MADTYSKELNLGYGDLGSGASVKNVSGRYYFDEIDDTKGPLDQASFLNPSSSIGFATSIFNGDERWSYKHNGDYTIDGTWHNGNGLLVILGAKRTTRNFHGVDDNSIMGGNGWRI